MSLKMCKCLYFSHPLHGVKFTNYKRISSENSAVPQPPVPFPGDNLWPQFLTRPSRDILMYVFKYTLYIYLPGINMYFQCIVILFCTLCFFFALGVWSVFT